MGRFYPIIDLEESGAAAGKLAASLCGAGCRFLQVRAKGATSAEFYTFTKTVIQAAGPDCRVIVNDRFDIALAAGASGVHLGEHDLPVGPVRKLAPEGFTIGATARDPETARRAESDGADYIGAGAVFPTRSKNDTRLIGLPGLAALARAVRVPVYGIAGVSLANCASLVRAGAYGAAGITVVSRASDPGDAYLKLEKALEDAAGSS